MAHRTAGGPRMAHRTVGGPWTGHQDGWRAVLDKLDQDQGAGVGQGGAGRRRSGRLEGRFSGILGNFGWKFSRGSGAGPIFRAERDCRGILGLGKSSVDWQTLGH